MPSLLKMYRFGIPTYILLNCFQLLNDGLSGLPKDPKAADAFDFRKSRELFNCYIRAAPHTLIDHTSKNTRVRQSIIYDRP
jgi:hypothetical protein